MKRRLESLYLKQNLSIKEINQRLGISNASKLLDKYHISKRTPKENFRIFIIGACRKHRDPNIDYYSNLESAFELIINDFGFIKGIHFFHDHPLPPTKCLADFYFPQARLDVEIDASIWHDHKDHSGRDAKLRNLGYEVVRFSESELSKEHIKEKLTSLVAFPGKAQHSSNA
jgi:very-short-patch-repair endonuclease